MNIIKKRQVTLSSSIGFNINLLKISLFMLSLLIFIACSDSSSHDDDGKGNSSVSNALLSLRLPSTNINEGENLSVTVARVSNNVERNIDFSWYIPFGSDNNKNILDFTGNIRGNGRLSIGSTTTDITINTYDDNLYEGAQGEDFVLVIQELNGSTIYQRFSILNNDNTPDINIALLPNTSRALNVACSIREHCEGGLVTFRVSLDEISGVDTNVSWNISGNELLELGANVMNGNAIIPAGKRYIDINLRTIEDSIYQGNREYEFSLNRIENAIIGGDQTDSARVVITDSLQSPAISTGAVPRVEEGGDLEFFVDIGAAVENNVVLNWQVSDMQDLVGQTSGQIIISSGETVGTISIPTVSNMIANNIVISDITVEINVDTSSNAFSLFADNNKTVLGQITDYIDNDNSYIYTEQSFYLADEGEAFNINVFISTTDIVDVTFDWVASSPVYGSIDGVGTILTGSYSTAITFDFTSDGLYGRDATGVFAIRNIGGRGKTFALSTTSTNLRIQNTSPLPNISFGSNSQIVNIGESVGNAGFRLELDRASLLDTVASYRIEFINANNSDFTNNFSNFATIDIPANTTVADIILSINDDNIHEGNESFNINLINVREANISNRNRARVTIIDDDDLPQLTITTGDINEGGFAIYTVGTTGTKPSSPITFDWNLDYNDMSTSDLVINNNDFIEYRGNGSIRLEEATTTIILRARDDNIYEGVENFRINLSNVVGASAVMSGVNRIGGNTGIESAINFSLGNKTRIQQEGTIFNFTLNLNKSIEREIQVSWGLLFSGLNNAASYNDFDTTSGIVAFEANSINPSVNFFVRSINDNTYDRTEVEEFQLQVNQILGSQASLDIRSATQVIRDDADNPNAILSIASNSSSNVVEGQTIGIIVTNFGGKAVNRDTSFSWEIDFLNSSADIDDFSGVTSGLATIDVGSSEKIINIEVVGDNEYELSENFVFRITNVDDIDFIGTSSIDTITIIDKTSISVAVSGDGNFNESSNEAFFVVSLTNSINTPTYFNWNISTIGGLANVEAIDVTSTSGSSFIAADATTTKIRIGINNDNIYEGNEVFTLSISGFSDDLYGRNLIANGVIINDDPQPALQVLDVSAREGDGLGNSQENLNFIINFEGPTLSSAYPVSVNWLIKNGTAIRGVDYNKDVTSGVITIPELAFSIDVPVTIISNETIEASKNFTIDLIGLANNSDATISANNRATGIILDDDGVGGELSTISAIEGSPMIFNFAVNILPTADNFTWKIATSDGIGRANNADFIALSGNIFIDEIRSYDIVVSTINTNLYEGDETFRLIVMDSLGDEITSTIGIITEPEPNLSLTTSGSIIEGESENIIVTLSKPSIFFTPFHYKITGVGTSDINSSLTGVGSILKNSTSANIIINTVNDNNIGNKQLNFTIFDASNATIATPSIVLNIIDDDGEFTVSGDSIIEEGSNATYNITTNSINEIAVDITIDNISRTITNNDYTLNLSNATIDNNNPFSVTITALGDSIYEANESINLVITDSNDSSRIQRFPIAIRNTTPFPNITLSSNFIRVDEGSNASFSVSIPSDNRPETDINFNYTVEGTGDNLAVVEDFGSSFPSGRIILGSTAVSADIVLTPLADTIYEEGQGFSLSIVGDTIVGGSNIEVSLVARGLIINTTPIPEIMFRASDIEVNEGENLSWDVRIANNSLVTGSELPIKYRYIYAADSTSSEVGDDDIISIGSNNISSGDSLNTIRGSESFNYTDISSSAVLINVASDNIYERTEALSLRIYDVSNAVFINDGNLNEYSNNQLLVGDQTADAITVFLDVINTNEAPTLSIADANANIGDDIVFTITKTGRSELPARFYYSTINQTAASGDHFIGVFNGLGEIAPTDTTTTISINTRNNVIDIGVKNFTVSIDPILPDARLGSSSVAMGSIVLDLNVDRDGDGLIEIDSVEELHNIRYNLAGTSYKESSNNSLIFMRGCPSEGCSGYELTSNLDFDRDGDGRTWSVSGDSYTVNSGDAASYFHATNGWDPIGDATSPFQGVFEGNGYTINNLAIVSSDNYLGLFGNLGVSADIRGVNISNALIRNIGFTNENKLGILAGVSSGIVTSSDVVSSRAVSFSSGYLNKLGGLVGHQEGGKIIASSVRDVVILSIGVANDIGGLVGRLDRGDIVGSYAKVEIKDKATFIAHLGGLGGFVHINSRIIGSYAEGTIDIVSNNNKGVGGLVGYLGYDNKFVSQVIASYANIVIKGENGSNNKFGGLLGIFRIGGVIASYATGKIKASGGSIGKLIGANTSGNITESYGFSSIIGAETNTIGSLHGITSISKLTTTNAGSSWNEASSKTSGAWTDNPVLLKYADYDGVGNEFVCLNEINASTPSTAIIIPNCNRLIPGQKGVGYDLSSDGVNILWSNSANFYRINRIENGVEQEITSGDISRFGDGNILSWKDTNLIEERNYSYVVEFCESESESELSCSDAKTVSFFNTIVDRDGDGLIDIDSLEKLNNIRYNLAGISYKTSSNSLLLVEGCPNRICRGYELTRDLDFDRDGDGSTWSISGETYTVDSGDATSYFSATSGWSPIGNLTDPFQGSI